MTAGALGEAVRAHRRIENPPHRALGTAFREDFCRVRNHHGARNMAVARHFALNLLRNAKDKYSINLHRKRAGWDPDYLARLIEHSTVNLD